MRVKSINIYELSDKQEVQGFLKSSWRVAVPQSKLTMKELIKKKIGQLSPGQEFIVKVCTMEGTFYYTKKQVEKIK